jgi:hypothetical protein
MRREERDAAARLFVDDDLDGRVAEHQFMRRPPHGRVALRPGRAGAKQHRK